MQVSTDLLDDTVLLSIHPGEVLPSSALPTPWFCWMWWRRLRGCSTGIHLFFRLNNFLIMVARFYALITLEEGEDIEMKVLPCSRISVTFLLPCLVNVTICFSFPLSELGWANLSLGLIPVLRPGGKIVKHLLFWFSCNWPVTGERTPSQHAGCN